MTRTYKLQIAIALTLKKGVQKLYDVTSASENPGKCEKGPLFTIRSIACVQKIDELAFHADFQLLSLLGLISTVVGKGKNLTFEA